MYHTPHIMYHKIVPLIALLFIILNIGVAFAVGQVVYFDGPTEVPLGSEFSVRILVDSDQPLNAYSMKWAFSSRTVEFVNFNNGNSLISVWQEQPTVFSGGDVELNGGSVASFNGDGGEILTINFKAIKEGEAVFSFENATAFLANGKGTKVVPQTKNLSFEVVPIVADLPPQDIIGEGSVVPDDTSPPEIKFLELIDDPFNSKQKLLGFSVADSDSGIKETLVRTRSGVIWGGWKPARNPTAIPNSVWAAEFLASDNDGNVVSKTVYNKPTLLRNLAILFGVLVAILVIAFFTRRSRKNLLK